MNTRIACLLYMAYLSSAQLTLLAQSRCPLDTRADDLATAFNVTAQDVRLPLGAFILIRRDDHIGAIRLTRFGNASATYESYYQKQGVASFSKASGRSGTLNLQPIRGPGRGIYTYKPGPYQAHIGKWNLPFDDKGRMSLTNNSFWTGTGEHRFEFALTSACDISEVDAKNQSLRWFSWVRYDTDRKAADFKLATLPK